MSMTVEELAQRIGASVRGDGALRISGCGTLEGAGPEDVSFLANRKYLSKLKTSGAGAIILAPDDVEAAGERTLLVADDPYFAFREAMVALVGFRQHPAPGISDQAVIADSASIGHDCHIGPFAIISDRARLGDRCVIYPHVYVGPEVQIGDDCVLFPQVTIYDRSVLGDRVTLHAGCSIGQDGFGYATHARPGEAPAHHKIPQAGHVIIEDDVELGAHCSVDRATVGTTVIGAGSKFSNGVTLGHGCRLGKHNLIVAQVGMAGSTETGDYVVMGGQVGVAGHLKIGSGAQLAGRTGVTQSIDGGRQYGGTPAVPLSHWRRQRFALNQLPELLGTVRQMKRRIAELEAKLGGSDAPPAPSTSSREADAS